MFEFQTKQIPNSSNRIWIMSHDFILNEMPAPKTVNFDGCYEEI